MKATQERLQPSVYSGHVERVGTLQWAWRAGVYDPNIFADRTVISGTELTRKRAERAAGHAEEALRDVR